MARLPPGLVELTNVPGIGPKRARALYDKLKVHSVADLKKAATAGKLHGLAGFGAKSEAKLLDELRRRREVEHRFRLDVAEDFAEPLVEYLKRAKGVTEAVVAGSYRRRKETVGDLDILVAAEPRYGCHGAIRRLRRSRRDCRTWADPSNGRAALRAPGRFESGSRTELSEQHCIISRVQRRTTSPSASSGWSAGSRSMSTASSEAPST